MKVGHGIDIDKEVSISSEDNANANDDEEYESDNDDDEEALAAQREAWNVRMYQQYFGQVRGEAPVEVRKALEIPDFGSHLGFTHPRPSAGQGASS